MSSLSYKRRRRLGKQDLRPGAACRAICGGRAVDPFAAASFFTCARCFQGAVHRTRAAQLAGPGRAPRRRRRGFCRPGRLCVSAILRSRSVPPALFARCIAAMAAASLASTHLRIVAAAAECGGAGERQRPRQSSARRQASVLVCCVLRPAQQPPMALAGVFAA